MIKSKKKHLNMLQSKYIYIYIYRYDTKFEFK